MWAHIYLACVEEVYRGETPYQCILCDKVSGSNCSLESHTKLHTGERPQSCKICDIDTGKWMCGECYLMLC